MSNNIIVICRRMVRGKSEETRHWLQDVEAFYAESKYVLLRTIGGTEHYPTTLFSESLKLSNPNLAVKDIQQFLDREIKHGAFICIHRGVLINPRYMAKLRKNAVGRLILTLMSGQQYPVGRRHAKMVRKLFKERVPSEVETEELVA
ncbi:MAG: LytTr DNA-binding domain [Pseudomonadota bacterium]|jgi:DNA-binding LytR/AlgR family response regulator